MTDQPRQRPDRPAERGDASPRAAEQFDDLFAEMYADLKKLAHGQLLRWRPGDSMNTTALVHEVWLKFEVRKTREAISTEHFYALAARAMRQVLVDFARHRGRQKRGGHENFVELKDQWIEDQFDLERVLVVDEALQKLEQHSTRLARVVELRYIVGFTEREIAEISGVTTRTIRNEWARARAWLREAMSAEDSEKG